MNSKVLTLLGFAAKAGKLSFGMDSAIQSVIGGKSYLAVLAEDVSAKSQKEVLFQTNKKGVKVLLLTGCPIAELGHAVGRRCGIMSVNDKGFAEAVLKAANKI